MRKRIVAWVLTLSLVLTGVTVFSSAEDGGSWYDGGEAQQPEQGTPWDQQTQPEQESPMEEQPPADPVYFPDVQPGDWYYPYVNTLYEAGVINGFTDGTFQPGSKVTTGQALKMIILAAGYPEPPQAASHWARGYLDFAIDQGFIVRFEDITDLDISISRRMVAKIAANALSLQRESAQSLFTDTDDDFVCALAEAGIVGGYPDGSFRPKGALTRAELSAIVNRIYDYRTPAVDFLTDDRNYDPVRLRSSEQLIEFLKQKEGFLEYAAWDYAQYSIGYGTYCDKDEFPNGITREEADYRMRLALAKFEASLDDFLEKNNLTLTDNQYDALISLSYNIGSGWMKNSNLADMIKSGRYTHNEIASAIGIWCHVRESSGMVISKGLLKRRISEIRIFLYGDYSGTEEGFNYILFTTQKGERERDIAVYETGSTYDPMFRADRAGDTFLGWFTDDGRQITESSIVQEDLTVTARWQSDEGGVTEPDVTDEESGDMGNWWGSWLQP